MRYTRDAVQQLSADLWPYPYPQITVVDPAWGSAAGGLSRRR